MGIIIALLCATVIYRLARKLSGSAWVALAVMSLWWLAPQAVVYQVGGMETVLAVFATMLIFYVLLFVLENPSMQRLMIMGAVCGFGFLCRTDTLILTAAAIVGLVAAFARVGWMVIGRRLVVFAICMVIVISPWILFTRSLGKGFMPESGDAVRLISAAQFLSLPAGPANVNQTSYGGVENLTRLTPFLISYLQNFALNVYLTAPLQVVAAKAGQTMQYNAALVSFIMFIAVLLIVFRGNRNQQWRNVMRVWMLYAVVIGGMYSFYVIGYWFFQRYTLPMSESLAVLASCFLLYRLSLLKRVNHRAWGIGIAGVFGVAYLLVYLLNPNYNWIVYGPASKIDNEFDAAVVWMNENLEPTDRVGAFQSGLMTYYTHAQFINLDGKVNIEAHEAMQAGDMWSYVCRAKINYIVDMQIVMEALLIHRSQAWDAGNLILAYGTNLPPDSPMWQTNVYKVNCPGSEN
jgi:4-amino-4-deoxy-L-arabinose transferase-like glycosyltransferase